MSFLLSWVAKLQKHNTGATKCPFCSPCLVLIEAAKFLVVLTGFLFFGACPTVDVQRKKTTQVGSPEKRI
jgi:hypothetical protein